MKVTGFLIASQKQFFSVLVSCNKSSSFFIVQNQQRIPTECSLFCDPKIPGSTFKKLLQGVAFCMCARRVLDIILAMRKLYPVVENNAATAHTGKIPENGFVIMIAIGRRFTAKINILIGVDQNRCLKWSAKTVDPLCQLRQFQSFKINCIVIVIFFELLTKINIIFI